MQLPEHYPPLLADIAHLLHLRLSQHLAADHAETLAFTLTEDLRLTFNGCQIYIPKGREQICAQRDAAVVRDFNGRNHAVLAKKYAIPVAHVYAILARRRAERQQNLFS